MKHIRGHYLLAVFAVCVTFVTAAVYFYMSSAVERSLTKSIASREAVKSANSNKNREQSFLATYEKTEKDWARLPGFLVPSDDVVRFIEAIESLGRSAGSELALSSIDADGMETSKKGATGYIRAHVSAEGTWSSVMRTLRLAEVMPYKVSVNNVRLDISRGEPGKTSWNLTFDIKAVLLVGAASSSAPVGLGTK